MRLNQSIRSLPCQRPTPLGPPLSGAVQVVNFLVGCPAWTASCECALQFVVYFSLGRDVQHAQKWDSTLGSIGDDEKRKGENSHRKSLKMERNPGGNLVT